MHKLVEKFYLEIYKLPVFIQVLYLSVTWILLVCVVDCWFSPFIIRGYQLITCLALTAVLSAWLTHKTTQHLIHSASLSNSLSNGHSSVVIPNLSLCELTEKELHTWAKYTTKSAIQPWYSEMSDDVEFLNEIQSQIEDILYILAQRICKIDIELFICNSVQMFHNHVKNFIYALQRGSESTVLEHFHYSHPTSRGDLTIETYLDRLSQTVLQQYIPGSFQDCRTIFSLSCAIFSSQVLYQFINHVSKPDVVLQSIIQIIQSKSVPIDVSKTDSSDSTLEVPSWSNSGNSSGNSAVNFKDSSTLENDENAEGVVMNLDYPDAVFNGGKSSPVLAGTVYPVVESCIRKGLCSSLSTLTIPLLPQCGDLHFNMNSSQLPAEVCHLRKPNSLPIINSPDMIEETKRVMSAEDVSPVYEDVEDFATAIAKLRSLLEQRESTGCENSWPKMNVPTSPTALNGRICSSGGETESSFEELTEASEIPTDSRVFLNVRITHTELCTQPGGGQYSVYCILYDGIYAAETSIPENVEEAQPALELNDTRLVLKSRSVRRRFREFLQLHSQLECYENPLIRNALRVIRGPSKWLNLPFSRLDQNTVAHRRMFLERYLQQLCSSVHIGATSELRQFLDYEFAISDAASSSASSQRLPFFVKTVSGVLQSIKTALPLPLPGFDNEGQNNPVQLVPLPALTPLAQSEVVFDKEAKTSPPPSVDDVDADNRCNIALSTEMSRLEYLLSSYTQNADFRVDSAYEAMESHLWKSEMNLHIQESPSEIQMNKLRPVTTSSIGESWDRFDEAVPLASCFINLAAECLSSQDTWLGKAPIPFTIKVMFGKYLENIIRDYVCCLTKPESFKEHIKVMREKLCTTLRSNLPATDTKDKDIEHLKSEVVELLENHIPGLTSQILGKQLCTNVLMMMTSCLTYPQLNRDLGLTFLDFLFSQISASNP